MVGNVKEWHCEEKERKERTVFSTRSFKHGGRREKRLLLPIPGAVRHGEREEQVMVMVIDW